MVYKLIGYNKKNEPQIIYQSEHGIYMSSHVNDRAIPFYEQFHDQHPDGIKKSRTEFRGFVRRDAYSYVRIEKE